MKSRLFTVALTVSLFTFAATIFADDTVITKKAEPSTSSAPAVKVEAAVKTPSKKKPTSYELEKMVVTPSRNAPQNIIEVPQAVSSISDQTIGSSVYTTVNDVVQTVPGVTFAPSTGSGDSTNRNSDYWNSGFSLRGLGAQRVLVLTDGVRQSGQGVGYGGGNLSLYDLSAVDHIEVIKGPSSVLYGTDAFGGVVQVFSHQPKERDAFGVNGRVRTSYDGSRNVASNSGYVDVGDKKWGIVLGGAYDDAHLPTLPHDQKAEGGDYTKQSGNFQFVYRPTEDSQLKILANVVEARDIDIFNDSSPGLGDFFFKIPFYQRAMFGAEYSQQNVNDYIKSWSIGLYEQELKRQFIHATPDFFVISPPFTDTVTTHDTVRTTELQPQIVFDFAPHTLTVGSDFGYDTTYLPEHSTQTGDLLKADANQTRESIYAQDKWQLDEKNILTLGARYDNFDLSDNLSSADKSTDGASGSLGFTHLFDPKTSAYVTVASGFRSPDLDERYQDTTIKFFTDSVTVLGNPNLNPERSTSIDIGTKKESSAGDFELSGYYNNIEDFIGTRLINHTNLGFGLSSDTQQRENVGTVAVYGFEAGWKTSREGHWRNYVNVARSWTDHPENLALTNYQINYGIGYEFRGIKPFTKITPQWMGRWINKSEDSVDHVSFPSFHDADAQVAFEWKPCAATRTQLVVGMKNIFNANYEMPFFAQPQPGRGAFAALQVDF